MFGKLDATKNEVHDLVIRGTPTLKLWPKGRKARPVDYHKRYTVHSFAMFLKEFSKYTPILTGSI